MGGAEAFRICRKAGGIRAEACVAPREPRGKDAVFGGPFGAGRAAALCEVKWTGKNARRAGRGRGDAALPGQRRAPGRDQGGPGAPPRPARGRRQAL